MTRNTFREPNAEISTDSEDEAPKPKIDWSKVFIKEGEEGCSRHKVFVPGFRALPPYPKLSTLTVKQHHQSLKVLCARNPTVLQMDLMLRPTKEDEQIFEEVQVLYVIEQEDFKEFSRSMWQCKHMERVLRTNISKDLIYIAEFEMRAKSMKSFPKEFKLMALIDFSKKSTGSEMVPKADLIVVNIADLPRIDLPDPILKKFVIIRPCPVPRPCNMHPSWFYLPNQNEMSVLPLTLVHRELAQYAYDHGAQFIASEGALKCLVQMDKDWMLPLTVCEVIGPAGDKKNVVVIGSEFQTRRQPIFARNYRAFRHLLDSALKPFLEKGKLQHKDMPAEVLSSSVESLKVDVSDGNDDSDEKDENYSILSSDSDPTDGKPIKEENDDLDDTSEETRPEDESHEARCDSGLAYENKEEYPEDFDSCSCKDSLADDPPPRSFKKWQLKNDKNSDKFDIIVHSAHKMKGPAGEVIAEPIVEYQIDLGGTKQSDDKIKSLALSLFLRKNASVLNVRVDSASGEVVTVDTVTLEDIKNTKQDILQEITNHLYDTFSQLKNPLTGHYILQHEVSLGPKAFLYSSRAEGAGKKMHLNFNCAELSEAEEMQAMKNPPVITDVLLPVHKFRKILPCAFPPFESMVVKMPKKKPFAKKKKSGSSARGSSAKGRKWPKQKAHKKRK